MAVKPTSMAAQKKIKDFEWKTFDPEWFHFEKFCLEGLAEDYPANHPDKKLIIKYYINLKLGSNTYLIGFFLRVRSSHLIMLACGSATN